MTVPTLNVAGWWDQEDFVGPITIYEHAREIRHGESRTFSSSARGTTAAGTFGDGRKLGNIDFGSATAKYFRDSIEVPFFDFYLKDKGNLKQPEALVFESGSNVWRTYDAWPPKSGRRRATALLRGERQALVRPAARRQQAFDSYVSDPKHPVPYRHRPIEANYDPRGSGWRTWLVEDQRFVTDRPDVLVWRTEPLTEDVTIAGEVVAKLFASTSGTDGDWVVKLIDVYPENVPGDAKMGGYELMVSNDVFRARYLRERRPSASRSCRAR